MSRAWMPLYIGDYLADTAHLSTIQHGAYLLLIMHYWQHGGLPARGLARIANMDPPTWRSNCKAIATLFQQPGWRHKRVDLELEKARKLSERRALIGALGGRRNAGLNNQQRHLKKMNGDKVPKLPVAQSQSHIRKKDAREKEQLGISSALAEAIRAKGWV